MSSDLPLVTIDDLIRAYNAEISARSDGVGDTRDGAIHNIAAGIGALTWSRQSARDRDVYRTIYFDTARGADLEGRIEAFGGASRIQATRGAGAAEISRATTAGGAGTLWKGTRISVGRAGFDIPRLYQVAADTVIGAATLGAWVPIEACDLGTGVEIDTGESGGVLSWHDQVWDSTWQIASLRCANGTDRESDPAYLARYRAAKVDARRGYAQAIIDACKAVGAADVALFESDVIAPDTGLNRCFVGDTGGNATPDLLRACRLAVEGARVLGCDLTVFGMARSLVSIDLTIRLWSDPGNFAQGVLVEEAKQSVLRYFDTGAAPYVFRLDGLRAELTRAIPDMQSVAMTSGPTDTVFANVLAGATLTRMHTHADAIRITLEGPQ